MQARLVERQEVRDAIWARLDDDTDQSAVRLSCRQFCADMDAVQPQRIRRDASLALRARIIHENASEMELALLSRVDRFVVPPNPPLSSLHHRPSAVAQALAARDDYREVRLGACRNSNDRDGIRAVPAWVRPLGQAIAQQKRLQVLDLTGPAWGAGPIALGLSPHLAQLGHLRELFLGKAHMKSLADILAANIHLTRLAFVCSERGPGLQAVLPALAGCSRLQTLSVGKAKRMPSVWRKFLKTLATLPALQQLTLDRARLIDGETVPALLIQDADTDLRTLQLLGCNDDAMKPVFAQMFDTAPKLTELKITVAYDEDIRAPLRALAGRCAQLQKLTLEPECLGEEDCDLICQALAEKTEITQVQLRFDYWVNGILGLDGRQFFSAVSNLPKLAALEISGGNWAMQEPLDTATTPFAPRFAALQSLTYKGSQYDTSRGDYFQRVLASAPNLCILRAQLDVMLAVMPAGLPHQVHTWEAHLDLLDEAAPFCAYVNGSPQVTRLQVARAGCLTGPKLKGSTGQPKAKLLHVRHLEFLQGYDFHAALPFYAPKMRTLRIAPQVGALRLKGGASVSNLMNLIVHAPELQEIVIETALSGPVVGMGQLRRAVRRHFGTAVSLRSEPVDCMGV